MTKKNKLRHSEYYDLQDCFDKLYAKSKHGDVFTNLMEIISTEENIRLAYRNIKRNSGSQTGGVDKLNIKDIEKLSAEKLVEIIQRKFRNYKPKPVKRVEIPKPNGKTRPLGIPTIIDRLVQQCVLQVLEPICEAKFHERSNGFRPNRSAEHALAQCYRMIQRQDLHFVVDIDVKGFFDNVNHSKLIRQMWTLGIRDKQLICIIKAMLKAPIDCVAIQFQINTVLYNRLNGRLEKQGSVTRKYIAEHYGKSKMLRYISGEPLCPIGYVQTKNPMYKKKKICKYTAEGREEIHRNLKFDETVISVLHTLARTYLPNRSVEYMDNRVSLYAAQYGKCAVTGKVLWIDEIHCHHKKPISQGGTDEYKNLIIVHIDVHKLIHATKPETIQAYLNKIKPNKSQLEKINKLRVLAGNSAI